MLAIDRAASLLLIIDFQSRLMPAIDGGDAAITNARRLLQAADMLGVPALFTEENPHGLGPTVPELADFTSGRTVAKTSFDACREPGFIERLHGRSEIVVAGCETHVCVLQTVLGLLDAGKRVSLVQDAVGSRTAANKAAALERAARHGADIVTTEMVVFEWLETAVDPRFRDVLGLVK